MKKNFAKLTMSFISASANDLPSVSMHHATLFILKEILIAQEGLLFFSFSINLACAAFCIANLNAEHASILSLCIFASSFFNPWTWVIIYQIMPIVVKTWK